MDRKLCFIDVETTGLYETKHGVTQLAAIIDINGKVEDEIDLKMSPFKEDWIDDRALAVTGVNKDTLFHRPDPVQQYVKLLSTLEKFVRKSDDRDRFFFVAYNAPFDDGFVRNWIKKCGGGPKGFSNWFWNPNICIMNTACLALMEQRHEMDNFRLGTVADKLGLKPTGDLHDALVDIRLSREIFYKITQG